MSPARLTPGRRLLLLALALTAARLLAAALIPLTEDEAYYRVWADHLQAGYLDHPPMIAWWIRAGEQLFGATALGVRLLPCLATGASTWLVGDTARALGLSEPTSRRAALWWNATFTVALGGLLATPDVPASFFWSVTLWALARSAQDRAGAWWLLAGAAAGLCCLSKYSGFFLAPGVLLWLLVTPGGLAQLKRPWPWLAALAAAVVFAPNLIWNAANDWLTFDKQFGRVGAKALHLARAPEFIATQALLLNPLIAAAAALGAARMWRERQEPVARALWLPLALALPFLLYLAAHSLHDRVQGHWPVPTFSAFAIVAAYAAERLRPWWRTAVPALGLGVSALVLAYGAAPAPLLPPKQDPTLFIRGWAPFADRIEALRRQTGAAWVGTESYGMVSQLRAQGRIAAPVLQISERARWSDWDAAASPAAREPGLVIDLARRLTPEALGRCFSQVRPLGLLDRTADTRFKRRYAAYWVSGAKVDVVTLGCDVSVNPEASPSAE